MIKDITLGQYFPGNSVLHRLDARVKLILTCSYMVALFVADNAWGLLLSCVFMLMSVVVAHIPMRLVLRGVKPIVPIIVLTSLLNVFYVPGTKIFSLPVGNLFSIAPTYPGLALAVFMSVRIVFLIIGTSMLTYTTSPITLTDGLERLMSPLRKLHLPVHELSMMMTIALRFIPTLIEETDKIMSAQKARGADFETGNIMRRLRALVPIMVPLFVSAFRRAGELALAMDCRCYRGGEGRTRMRQLKLCPRDFAASALMAVLIAGVIVFNVFYPSMLS